VRVALSDKVSIFVSILDLCKSIGGMFLETDVLHFHTL